MAKWMALLSLVFLIGACEKNESVSFQNLESGQVFYLGDEVTFKGEASEKVDSVEVTLGGHDIDNVSPSTGSWETTIVFDELFSNKKLSLIGKDNEGQVVTETHYTITVVEKPVLPPSDMFNFDLPEPSDATLGKRMTLWATEYHLPQVSTVKNGDALRDMKGKSLGVVLSRHDWCEAALEGSIRVIASDGSGITYNYAGTSSFNQVDCSRYYSLKLGKTKFRKARGEYGDGVKNYKLIPYRTIAVDRSQTPIPWGTVVYIPAAKGNPITLPDGSVVKHDGYFFAGDTGGAIKGSHIDVYIGVAKKNPFKWVKSTSKGTFKAYIVNDPAIRDHLTDLQVY